MSGPLFKHLSSFANAILTGHSILRPDASPRSQISLRLPKWMLRKITISAIRVC